jgi:hypothetical protein
MITQNALNRWNRLDVADACVREDSMKEIICRLSVFVATSGFLVHIELALMEQWVAPLDQIDLVPLFCCGCCK